MSERIICVRAHIDHSNGRIEPMFQIEQTEAGLLIVVEGRIDGVTAEGFRNAVLSEVGAVEQTVVLDLAAVSFVSSAGLRALLQIAKSMGQGIRLCSLRPEVMSVFTMSGFDRVLSVFDSQDEAFAGRLMR